MAAVVPCPSACAAASRLCKGRAGSESFASISSSFCAYKSLPEARFAFRIKNRRQLRCAGNESFDPAQLQKDLERMKRQEEKKRTQKRQKILEATDSSPNRKSQNVLNSSQVGRGDFGSEALQRDLERIKGLQEKDKKLQNPLGDLSQEELQEAKSFFQTTKEWSDNLTRSTKAAIDSILVADFFFIILVLLWLVAGVVERQALDSTQLLDAWLPLWGTVFQPAIGVLMLGTIVSGTISSLSKDPNEN